MRLSQHTSVKRFGKMRARQNSLHISIHIGARCNHQPNNLNVACSHSNMYRGERSSFTISVAKMRLRQHTSVESFGKMRARQNSLPDSIHIGARCNQHRHYINVLLLCGNNQRD
jgi:hypothetical protein